MYAHVLKLLHQSDEWSNRHKHKNTHIYFYDCADIFEKYYIIGIYE